MAVADPQNVPLPEKKEEVVEEVKAEPIQKTPEQLTEIIGKPAMSQAELKKLAELKRLKREAKKKKEAEKTEDSGLPKLSAMALPPVMEKRKGGFEIPEFLKQEVKRDLIAVEEKDMMSEALKKQDEKNVDQFAGMSMAEIAAAKRAQTEK